MRLTSCWLDWGRRFVCLLGVDVESVIWLGRSFVRVKLEVNSWHLAMVTVVVVVVVVTVGVYRAPKGSEYHGTFEWVELPHTHPLWPHGLIGIYVLTHIYLLTISIYAEHSTIYPTPSNHSAMSPKRAKAEQPPRVRLQRYPCLPC